MLEHLWMDAAALALAVAWDIALGEPPNAIHPGVGIGKIRFLEAEHGESLALMKKLKTLLDPDNLFNPGKIFL